MEYPRDRLYVQCLDDSTDPETREVFYEGVRHWQALGIKIEAIRRTNRKGYKAGAMHEVHDLRAIPPFQDKNVGFVQGRWTYLNADESLFCRYQEICLNAHIKCEQVSVCECL